MSFLGGTLFGVGEQKEADRKNEIHLGDAKPNKERSNSFECGWRGLLHHI